MAIQSIIITVLLLSGGPEPQKSRKNNYIMNYVAAESASVKLQQEQLQPQVERRLCKPCT